MPAVYKSVYYDLHVDMLIVTVVSDTLCPAKRLLFVANVCISQARWQFSNSFLMMILFVYVTVLSVSFSDERLQFSQMG